MNDVQETDRVGTSSRGNNPETIGAPSNLLQMFCNSSGLTFHGGSFNNIGGDMNIYNAQPEDLQRWEATLREFMEIRRLLQRISPAIGHTSANALIITDALGETLTIPWALVSSYEGLHDALVNHFRHKIGERRVLRRDYCIAQAHGGMLVEADRWKDIMDTGKELIMLMLIDRYWLEEAWKLCPKCGRTPIGTYEVDGWQICRRCNTRFRCVERSSEENSDLFGNKNVEEAAFRHVQGRYKNWTTDWTFTADWRTADWRTADWTFPAPATDEPVVLQSAWSPQAPTSSRQKKRKSFGNAITNA